MKLSLSFLLLAFSVGAQSAWTGIKYYPGWNFFPVQQQTGEICSFDFPDASMDVFYAAFLVETNASPFSLSNRTVSITFSLECSSNAVFRYAGEDWWNFPGLPANARLFFSTVAGYYDKGPYTNYWFHSDWIELSTNTGTATLSAALNDPVPWSGGQGEVNSNAFWYASSHVLQVGIAFGGGSFYDIGDAVADGTATLRLKSFSIDERVEPPTSLIILSP